MTSLTHKFEDLKEEIRSRKSKKDRQYNGHKEQGQKYQQWSTKHYTENWTLCDTNPTKNPGGKSMCSGRDISSIQEKVIERLMYYSVLGIYLHIVYQPYNMI
jgi:hypothetical protein